MEKKEALKIIQRDGLELKNLPAHFKKDKEIVLEAIKHNVYALMWWNIAGSSGNKNAVKNRVIIAKKMTPADISAAEKLARECIRKKYKGC